MSVEWYLAWTCTMFVLAFVGVAVLGLLALLGLVALALNAARSVRLHLSK